MAVRLRVASWNVKHFRGDPVRFDNVVAFLEVQNPDVFAIYEVTGREVYRLLRDHMPDYSISITEGEESQEILVGARLALAPVFTQRPDLRSGVDNLRPGALVTVIQGGEEFSFLFLHTKSGSDPRSMGLRDDMIKKAFSLNSALQRAAEAEGRAPANYIFCGDLNTMGMEYTHLRSKDIETGEELQKLAVFANRRDMRLLPKTHNLTWSGGSGSSFDDSPLDHVIAAKHMNFTTFVGGPDNDPAPVEVRGWHQAPNKNTWIAENSDHNLLYMEVTD